MTFNMIFSLLALAAMSLAQSVYTTGTYVEPKSNMKFQTMTDGMGYIYGMALPTTPGKDLIGLLVAPIAQGGWMGVDFGATMSGHMEVVAWPNGATVMTSFRISAGYNTAQTTVYNKNSVAITQIPAGTYINDTSVVVTFLCTNCINTDSFSVTAAAPSLSGAFSTLPLDNPALATSPLNDHTGNGYGTIAFTLAAAKTSSYADYAAMVNAAAAPAAAAPAAAAPSAAAPPAPPAAAPSSPPAAAPSSPPAAAPSSPPAAAPSSPPAAAPSSPPAAAPSAPPAAPPSAGPTAGALAAPNSPSPGILGGSQPSMACVCSCAPVLATNAPNAANAAILPAATASPVPPLAALLGGIDSVPSQGPGMMKRRDDTITAQNGAGSTARTSIIGGGLIMGSFLVGLLIVLQGVIVL